MTQNINVFSLADCWECWWLWKKASLSSADVQSDVLSPSCMHETTFSIDHSFVDDILWYDCCLPMCQWGAVSSRWLSRIMSVAAI